MPAGWIKGLENSPYLKETRFNDGMKAITAEMRPRNKNDRQKIKDFKFQLNQINQV